MKKILAMLLSVAIIATIAISGTIAYFTDTESATNVFTVGNVNIELLEQQRNEDGTELEDFEQNKNLMPIVGSAQAVPKDKWGLTKKEDAKNYVDKIVRVKNIGKSDAWVRIFVAVPAALENSDASKNVLHWNFGNRFDATESSLYSNGTDKTAYANSPYTKDMNYDGLVGTQTINGIEYNVYSFTKKTPLAPGETSPAAFVGFYLDEKVDYNDKDGYYYMGDKNDVNNRITVNGVGANGLPFNFDSGVYIPVYAEAVQTAGFDTPAAAFAAAIEPSPSTKPYNPWGAGNATVEAPNFISTAAELANALNGLTSASGAKTISLSPNTVFDFSEIGWSPVSILNGSTLEITIDGNGAVIKNLSQPLFGDVKVKSLTIKNLTIDGAEMENNEQTGNVAVAYGAFIQYADNTIVNPDITLDGCHLKNSEITSVQEGNASSVAERGDYVGGLIGSVSTSGNVEIKNCSVKNCTIKGKASVGGLIGLRQGTLTVSNSSVKNSTLTSKKNGAWRVGAIIGTANGGSVITLTGCTSMENTMKQNDGLVTPTTGQSELYGRNATGDSGSITIS